MKNNMITIKQTVKGQYEIKKSVFIAYAFSVFNEDDIARKLQEIKKQYSDAKHICYAYVLNSQEKYCDDGEPNGTAGKPLLDLIKNKKYTNLLLVVIRYFGGIKLGAGGLYRAYITSGLSALDKCTPVQLKQAKHLTLYLSYENANEILARLQDYKIKETSVRYLDFVTFDCKLLQEDYFDLEEYIKKIDIRYTVNDTYMEEMYGNNN